MQVQCTSCHGTGREDETRDEHGETASCPECGGAGVVASDEDTAAAALNEAIGEAKEKVARLLRAAGVAL